MKRIWSLSLAAALVLSCTALGGCKNQPEENADTETYNISVLLHGQVVDGTYKYHEEVQEAINEKLYKDLGFRVKLNFTSYIDQFETMLALDMASGVEYDMVRGTTQIAAGYMQKGVIHDLTEMLDRFAPDIKAVVPASAFAENSFEGKIFGIPTCSFPIMYGMWFRGDWLKTLNRQVPKSLSELESLLEAIKTDSKINGSKKVVPMAGSRDFMEMVFLGMFTEHPGDYVDAAGKVRPKYLDPGYRAFTEKMAEWYKKGYIDDLLLNGNENAINDLISRDRVGIHVSNVFQLEYSNLKSYNEQKNLDMKWSIPFAADTKKYYSSGAANDIVFFPVKGKNTEQALRFYNWYYNNKENADLVLYGIRDKTYTLSTDSATGKPFVGIPESEKTDTVQTPADLIGFFGTNVHTSLQLYYTLPTRPAESAKAYDACNTQEIFDNYHLDVTRYFMREMPGTLGTKFEDARNMMISRVSEMMTGKRPSTDAEWAAMEAEFNKLGGREAYDWLTDEYNKIKDSLTFLKK